MSAEYNIIHKMRMFVQSLPIKKTDYRWRVCDRNQGIGWNECRLEMLKRIGELEINNRTEKTNER